MQQNKFYEKNSLEFLNSYPYGRETIILPSGKSVLMPKYFLTFKQWVGAPIADMYNNKAVIDFDGEPVFAELAILRLFQKYGWDGVWVDSYRKVYRIGLPKQVEPVVLPAERATIIDSIQGHIGGKWGGCWDVFLWKEDNVLFAESKRNKKDKIQNTQRKWLEAAIDLGYGSNLLLIEWGLQQ